MVDYRQIREELKFSPLTEEEKQKRGILARLCGPCASITDATRNGRLYSDELWEKVFNENEIVHEMFESGGIPCEMDHPVGREETDSSRIAAMIPEPPKRDKDGHLICCVDIIDTPCGKIAYQLAKYGFKLGISSRGSGDVRPDNSVDPDTYDFTTFDLVLLPAVKDARLRMCESLEKASSFEKAITESYKALDNDRDKEIMKEVLSNLDLDVELDEPVVELPDNYELNLSTGEDNASEPILDEDKDAEETEIEEVEVEEPTKDEKADDEKDESDETMTVKDIIDQLKEYKKDTEVTFKPIVIDGVEYTINSLTVDEVDDKNIELNLDYSSEMSDNNINSEEAENANDVIDEVKPEDESEEVIDDESEEVIESLKEAIRQNGLLEAELKTLKNEKTVGDTEVKKLSEELDKYKSAFQRTSKLASDAKKTESEVKVLKEQLLTKDADIKKLKSESRKSLVENKELVVNKIKLLTEKLNSEKSNIEKLETKLENQETIYKKKLNEKIEIAKKYKSQAESILNEYISFRSEMLGINPKTVVGQLRENYSVSNINSVFDKILSSTSSNNQFSLTRPAKVQINESKKTSSYENNDDDFEDLLSFAGLK